MPKILIVEDSPDNMKFCACSLTAHAMQGDQERALQAEFDGYIPKPIDLRGFPEQVERAVAGSSTL